MSDTTATVFGSAFSIDVSLLEGTHTLTAVQTDLAGNVSSPSQHLTVTVDTTPPAAPNVTGPSLTNDTTPTWTWTSAGDGNGRYRHKLDDGSWSSETPGMQYGTPDTQYTPGIGLSDGEHTLHVQECDDAGNWSDSGSFTITVDSSQAGAPADLDLTAADDSGFSDTDNITNQTSGLTITGTCEVEAEVHLYDNAAEMSGVTVEVSGTTFTIDISLPAGQHTITATQEDGAGNLSPHSASLVITVDTVSETPGRPELDPANDSGTSDTDAITNVTSALTVTGMGEPRATVQLYDGDTEIPGASATVSANETFTADISLSHGTHRIKAMQTDLAGNTSAPSPILTLEVDTEAPDPPSVSGPTSTDDDTPTWSWVSGSGGIGICRHTLLDSDGNELESTDETPPNTDAYTPTASVLNPGEVTREVTLHVQEQDRAGNWSARSDQCTDQGSGSLWTGKPSQVPSFWRASPRSPTTPPPPGHGGHPAARASIA